MSVALILSRGIEPALTAVGTILLIFIGLGYARLMLRVNEKARQTISIYGYIYPVTRLARFARFANAHLVYFATPTACYING